MSWAELAAKAANFADLIAALRPPLGVSGGPKPSHFEMGLWGAPAPQYEELASYFSNPGDLLTEGCG